MERQDLPSLESAIENLDSLLEEMAKTGGSSHSGHEVNDEGLETELDRLTSRLVSAMANRNSLEEEEEAVFCAGCNQRLLEPGLQADQGRFHSSCLSCHECAQPLSGDFWLVDGHRYCQLHRLAALPRCSSCGETANPEEGVVEVGGKLLHLGCLICRLCLAPIEGKLFTEEGGTFLCESDFRALQQESLPKCDQCKLPLQGQVLSALGQKLHPACFLCSHCGKGLGQNFLEAKGKPFCIECYSNEKAEKCNGCRMPIVPIAEGEQQIVRNEDGSNYHSACYNCANCHDSLLSQPAYRMEDGVMCERCNENWLDEKVREQAEIEKRKAIGV